MEKIFFIDNHGNASFRYMRISLQINRNVSFKIAYYQKCEAKPKPLMVDGIHRDNHFYSV